MNETSATEAPFAVGAVARLTGLSVHVLRSWERRYGAVRPSRTPRGSRRYTEADVERLRLLGAAVRGGHPIGAIAPLSDASLAALLEPRRAGPGPAFDELLDAIARLDTAKLERLLALQLFARGPRDFARDFALPLFAEIGARWESGRLSVGAEHVASFAAGTLLAGALRAAPRARAQRPILFTTPEGERHEFGVLAAALVTASVGANAVYLGPELPAKEAALAASDLKARAVALGLVALDPRGAAAYLRALRGALEPDVGVWIGGATALRVEALPDGVVLARNLDEFEARVGALSRRDGVAPSARR